MINGLPILFFVIVIRMKEKAFIRHGNVEYNSYKRDEIYKLNVNKLISASVFKYRGQLFLALILCRHDWSNLINKKWSKS